MFRVCWVQVQHPRLYPPPPWNYTQVDSGISQYSGIYPGVDSKLYPGVDPVTLRIHPSLPEYTPLSW